MNSCLVITVLHFWLLFVFCNTLSIMALSNNSNHASPTVLTLAATKGSTPGSLRIMFCCCMRPGDSESRDRTHFVLSLPVKLSALALLFVNLDCLS